MSGIQSQQPVQTISFSEVPYTWLVPGTYVEVHANYAGAGLLQYPSVALIVGQMLAAGTAVPNTAYQLQSAIQAEGWFGQGSVAADMAAAFLTANPWTQVWIIGVSDAAGAVKAAGTVTVTGAATASGTLVLYIAGNRVQTGVAQGDSAATVATNLLAAIEATSGLPVSAAAGISGVVDLTALHGGTLGNQIDLRLNYLQGDATPAGIIVALAAMAGGATDPVITSALNAIATSWYTDIVMAWSDATNVGALEAALVTRYQAMGKLDSHAYGAMAMTYATLETDFATLNSQFRSVVGVQNPPQPSWKWAAALAGVGSYNLANDPSRQLRGLPLPGILPPAPADQFTLTERENLLLDGCSTYNVEIDGTVVLERVVTEYKNSPLGVPDTAWRDIMVPRTMSRIRWDWSSYISLAYPRNKLSDDGTLAAEYDPTVVTPSRMKGAWASRCQLYARAGWLENTRNTVAQSTFVRNANDPNRLDARQQVQIIGNLMVLAARLEFAA